MAGKGKWGRKGWTAGALIVLILCGLLAWNGPRLLARAQLGAAYGARLGCSCRYVEGRAMGSCADDKAPGMALVRLEDLAESRAVKASVPLLASRTARFRPGWGCLLDPVG
jgi:membrane protein DedA with SNARE-associated domain